MTDRRSGAHVRPAVSLRFLLVAIVSLAVFFTIGIATYVALRVGAPARRIGQAARPMAALFDRLTVRIHELDGAVSAVHRMVGDRNVDDVTVARIRAGLTGPPDTLITASLADMPAPMRRTLARADREFARMANALVEVVALAELGRFDRAEGRLRVLDSLEAEVELWVGEAERQGLTEVAGRQRLVADNAEATARAVLWAALVSVALVVAVVIVIRTRVERPFAALDRGLSDVAGGNLAVQVPVRHDDEVGRLTEHFNEMTRILRDRAEEQGRFAAAGELLAGVAHEVNNPLMAIAALAENRLAERDLTEDSRADLQQILRQARRAGRLLAGLLRFVRPGSGEPVAADPNRVVATALDLVSYQFGVDEITVETDLAADLPRLHLEPKRLEQILVSLLSNALDAVRSREPPRIVRVRTWARARMVHVAVEDNGPGVAPEIADRLFLPFTTTKGLGGTGLGLYIARQIARELGGELELEPGPDTRFVVALPRTRATEAPAGPAQPRPSPVPGALVAGKPLAGIRVLYVEDDLDVRRSVSKFLARRGAQVIEAGDGLEALTAIERYQVDVVLLDLRMPRMDGVEFYTQLTQLRPALAGCVLFLSGDHKELAAGTATRVPPERLLAKPLDLATIEAKILEVAPPVVS